jgi:hypothetical protein
MAAKNSETVPTFDGKGNLTGSMQTGGKKASTVSDIPRVKDPQVTQRGEDITKLYGDLLAKYKESLTAKPLYGMDGIYVHEFVDKLKDISLTQILSLAAAEASLTKIYDEDIRYAVTDPRIEAFANAMRALKNAEPDSISGMSALMKEIRPKLAAYQKELDYETGRPELGSQKWIDLTRNGWNPIWDTYKYAEQAIEMAIYALATKDKITPRDCDNLSYAYRTVMGERDGIYFFSK